MILKNYIEHPVKSVFLALRQRNLTNWLPDTLYLKLMYRFSFGKKLNLKNPQTYNEKLQWLKLNDRRPEYVEMVDKYRAKFYIGKKIGDEYIIPILGVWDKFDDIEFNGLPNEFVLKCTHDSGGLVICRDKSKFDFNAARKKINRCMNRNYFFLGREWPYKKIKPRIIAEVYMKDNHESVLTDYKFFCFNGVPKIMYSSKDKSSDPRTDFFDMDYNHVNMKMRDPNADVLPPKPQNFELMKEISSVLSTGYPHLRVDFYEVNGRLYVGELTLYHCSGFAQITPPQKALEMGSWIKIGSI